jgi:hypothetical protein
MGSLCTWFARGCRKDFWRRTSTAMFKWIITISLPGTSFTKGFLVVEAEQESISP